MNDTHLALIEEDMVADNIFDFSGKSCVTPSFTITTHLPFASFNFSVCKRNKYVKTYRNQNKLLHFYDIISLSTFINLDFPG